MSEQVTNSISEPEVKHPGLITTQIAGEFPMRIGYWRLSKNSVEDLSRGGKVLIASIYLTTDVCGNIRPEFRSGNVLGGQTLNSCWGTKTEYNGYTVRYIYLYFPKSCDDPVKMTWTELYDLALASIKKISDMLVDTVIEKERQLQEEL